MTNNITGYKQMRAQIIRSNSKYAEQQKKIHAQKEFQNYQKNLQNIEKMRIARKAARPFFDKLMKMLYKEKKS